MHKSAATAFALLMSFAALPGCATKTFVRTSVGEVNSKVDGVAKTVEDTQQRTKQNEEKIGQVDQKAEAAASAAASAGNAANAAGAAAKVADAKSVAVDSRVTTLDQASKRLILQVTLSEDQGNFARGKSDLPDAARARIDQLINQLKADPKGVFIEVEGHTDN